MLRFAVLLSRYQNSALGSICHPGSSLEIRYPHAIKIGGACTALLPLGKKLIHPSPSYVLRRKAQSLRSTYQNVGSLCTCLQDHVVLLKPLGCLAVQRPPSVSPCTLPFHLHLYPQASFGVNKAEAKARPLPGLCPPVGPLAPTQPQPSVRRQSRVTSAPCPALWGQREARQRGRNTLLLPRHCAALKCHTSLSGPREWGLWGVTAARRKCQKSLPNRHGYQSKNKQQHSRLLFSSKRNQIYLPFNYLLLPNITCATGRAVTGDWMKAG